MKARSKRSPSRSASEEFLGFTGSTDLDQRLWKQDIAGSIAHAHTLAKTGVLTKKELSQTLDSLKTIASKFLSDEIVLDPKLEDIHMNIEKMLIDDIGDIGRKLHTGRSRNDQIALDLRLWARGQLCSLAQDCVELQKVLIGKATDASGIVMPGYTHLQHAQPLLLSHHLLAYFWKIQRDIERIHECHSRTNKSPLGAGALAGTPFRLDRSVAQTLLGMKSALPNSMDAVSDRDFAAESAFVASMLMIHLSSLAEEMILWSSNEFGFVRLPEDLSSGSSIMPQKRNPDIPELIRAKSGRAVGDLVAILTLLKSLPLAYNRDLQEGKTSLFDVFDTAKASLSALTHFLQAISFDKVRMRKAAEAGLMTATDLADFLTTRGVPFRTAHGIVKGLAEKADGDDRKFMELADAVVCEHLSDFKTSDLGFMSAVKSVERKNIYGGTSPGAVGKQMLEAKASVQSSLRWIESAQKAEDALESLLQ